MRNSFAGGSNPLLGESEGDQKKQVMINEYKDYMRSLEAQKNSEWANGSPTMSKRMTRFIEKKRETSSKSPTQ